MITSPTQMPKVQFHYTDRDGSNGIRAAPSWCFRASKPPCENPVGAYFTDYDERTPLLAAKLRIPKKKLAYLFAFKDAADLKRIRGGRGEHIFYSAADYVVVEERQIRQGGVGTE